MSFQPAMAHPGKSINLLDLNQDIFLHIVSFLDLPNTSLLSKTCRSLHNALAGQLLRGTVSIRRPLLDAFKQFLDAKGSGCSRHEFLKRWQFITVPRTATYSPSQVSYNVCAILKASHNLVSLSLDKVTPDDFQPTDLKTAFAAMPQLQELSLLSVGPKYADVLHGVLPNLRVLKLDFSTDRLSPLNFIATHRATLRELTLENIWPQATFPPGISPDPFPAVRRLRISPISSPSGLPTIARCFPNLDTLALHTVIIDEEWRQQHGYFAAVLERDQQGAVAPLVRWYDRTAEAMRAGGGTWPHLATLRVHDSVGLFFAPLGCTADRLEVVQATIMPEQMAHVYRELRPRVVVLLPESSPDAFLEAAMCHLVTLEHAPSVSHVTVCLSSTVVPGLPLDEVLAALTQALSRSSVSHLLLELSPLGEFGQSEELKAFYRDASKGMRLLSSSILSLRKIFFDIEGQGLKAWEMDTAGSGGWVEIDDWVALRVIAEEGMRDSGRAD